LRPPPEYGIAHRMPRRAIVDEYTRLCHNIRGTWFAVCERPRWQSACKLVPEHHVHIGSGLPSPSQLQSMGTVGKGASVVVHPVVFGG
jgi:hypothetical protein